MARNKKHEEHENHERWLVSYADFITLLFAFFVVMYSISSVNEGKYRVLSDSLVSAFKSSPKSVEPIQVGVPARSRHETDLEQRSNINVVKKPDLLINKPVKDQHIKDDVPKTRSPKQAQSQNSAPNFSDNASIATLKKMSDEIERAMAGLIRQDLVTVRRNEFWLEVEINTNILFPSGDAHIQAEAKPILNELAKILRNFNNQIKVEGFTDNVPINNIVYPSNWELSAARSASVVNLFMRQGIAPARMAAIGYGEFRPVADNSTPEGRNKNRRVVFAILEEGTSERVYDDYKFKQKDNKNISEVHGAGVLTTEPSIELPPQEIAQTSDVHATARVAEGRAMQEQSPRCTSAAGAGDGMDAGGRATQGAVAGCAGAANEPIDVTSREVTDRGVFKVMEPPVTLPSFFVSKMLPKASINTLGNGGEK